LSQAERLRQDEEYLQYTQDLMTQQAVDFGPLRARAVLLSLSILRELSPEQRLEANDPIAQIVLGTGVLSGPNPVGQVANYIERLSMLLPE